MAKVFISCGQNEGNDKEVAIAKQIGNIVEKAGYEPYVAILNQDSKSFRENIFRELNSTEYFLFIDLQRERVKPESSDEFHRGSLFCHQELAIASFLDIECAFFHQSGIKREGLGHYIQSNSVPFQTEEDLYEKIQEHLSADKWQSSWSNKFTVQWDGHGPSKATITNNQKIKEDVQFLVETRIGQPLFSIMPRLKFFVHALYFCARRF